MKLKATTATNTFINGRGYYAISQDGAMGEDSPIIELSPDQMALIISDMQEKLEDQKNWWFDATGDDE